MFSRKAWIWRVTLALIVVIVSVPSAEADLVNHGRFLPGVPVVGGNTFSYDNAYATFDHDVFWEDMRIGEIKFDYDTIINDENAGGAVLAGGFYLDHKSVVKNPGNHLAWVQTVRTTRNLANEWGIPDVQDRNQWVRFPDVQANSGAGRTDPGYPFQSLPVTPPTPPGVPSIPFQDDPSRPFTDSVPSAVPPPALGKELFWTAELGLVCISDTTDTDGFRQVFVMDTFLWGFNLTTFVQYPVFEVKVPASPPHYGVSRPSDSYLAILNDYYDGKSPTFTSDGKTSGGLNTSKFHFQAGCDDCFSPSPEPASIVLLVTVLAVMAVAARRHKAFRRQLGT